jgi:hypothetical protein
MTIFTKISFSSLLATMTLATGAGCISDDSQPPAAEPGTRPALERLAARAIESSPAVATSQHVGALESNAARVGVLWGTYADTPDADRPFEFELVVHELPVSGSFPDTFSIELSEPPPAELAGRHPTGVLVLLREDAEFGVTLQSERASGNVLPRLSASELETLGIVSMPAVYITYVADNGETVINANFGLDILEHGYHMAVFDGDIYSDMHRWYDCVEAAEDESVCGPYPYDENPDAAIPAPIEDGDVLTIHLGGTDDLISTPRPE